MFYLVSIDLILRGGTFKNQLNMAEPIGDPALQLDQFCNGGIIYSDDKVQWLT